MLVHDRIREAVILLVGELCAFLASTDPRIPHVINRLLAALGTPSEQVQAAVANCLPALVKSIKDGASIGCIEHGNLRRGLTVSSSPWLIA